MTTIPLLPPGHDGNPEFRRETITPALAAEILQRFNTRNRSLSEDRVRYYADQMARGEWHFTGDAIRRAPDGTLLDGQHRLAAVVRSNVPLDTLVVYGLPTDAQDVLDDGRRRNLGDVLAMQGERDPKTLSSAITWVWRFQRGAERSTERPSRLQGMRLLDEHPKLRDSVPYGRRAGQANRVHPSLVTALHYRFTQIDQDDANDFFDKFALGRGLHDKHPIAALRRRFRPSSQSRTSHGISAVEQLGLVIRAWNIYRDGGTAALIRFRPGGANAEPIPTPR